MNETDRVLRYYPDADMIGKEPTCYMQEDSKGMWVNFHDYEILRDKVKALEARIKELEKV